MRKNIFRVRKFIALIAEEAEMHRIAIYVPAAAFSLLLNLLLPEDAYLQPQFPRINHAV